MYNLAEIRTELTKRVGFRQTTHPDLPQLVVDLVDSDSGIYINDVHPLLNTANLFACAENYNAWNYEAWASGTYQIGDYVTHNSLTWVNTVANNTAEPSTNASWAEVNNFSLYLRGVMEGAVQKTLNKLFEIKKLERNTKTLFENIHLYDGSSYRSNPITKQGRFVGFAIRMKHPKYMSGIIRKLGTQFTGAATGLTIYLYHESASEPIEEFEINHTLANSFQWHNITDAILRYSADNQDSGGYFYIGYYEDDLPLGVEAKTRHDYNWQTGPCVVCSSTATDRAYFQKWAKYMEILPCYVASSYLNEERTRFENDKVSRVFNQSFGMNLQINAKCDLTDMIIDNIELFDDIYSKQIAYDFISQMAYNLRDNGNSKQIIVMAQNELLREDESGITKLLANGYKGIDFDMSGFNSVCLPENRYRGAMTGSIL